MKFKIEIDCANAAFDDGDCGGEIARILDNLADRVDGLSAHHIDRTNLYDINGNKVGVAYTEESE